MEPAGLVCFLSGERTLISHCDKLFPPPPLRTLCRISAPRRERKKIRFAAILTGRTSQRELDTRAVATARFNFHKKNLYYSVVHSPDMPRPKAIRFLGAEGAILEEQLLTENTYQNVTGKLCGVWWRVPRSYRQMLREEKVHIALLTVAPPAPGIVDEPRHLGGQIARYKGLNTELFSSLLEAAPENPARGVGGTAIITASSSAPSIHLSVVFNGAFSPDDVADVPLIVRLASDKHIVLDEVVRIHKPIHELNTLEVRSAVKNADLKLLARSKLHLSVQSKHHPEYRLHGDISVRVSCDIFQATLSSVEADDSFGMDLADLSSPHPATTSAAGMSWMYLARDGSLLYNVRLDDLDSPLTGLHLIAGKGRGRRQDIENLTDSFRNGWANGSVDRLTPRELEQLYGGELSVSVTLGDKENVVKGRLSMHPAADPRLVDAPLLLKRPNQKTPAGTVGMAWVSVDKDCSLLYEISLTGYGLEQRLLELYLEDIPVMASNAPISRKKIVEFYGPLVEGFTIGLKDIDLARLHSGMSFLNVVDQKSNTSILQTHIESLRLPPSCLPRISDNDLPQDEDSPMQERSCLYDGRFYKEGDLWRASSDMCSMCNCKNGRPSCEPIPCPATNCPNPTKKKGDCCPSCYNMSIASDESKGCQLGGLFHHAGSTWYPFLHPNGFDKCTLCTCDANSLQIRFDRQRCPPLNCPLSEAYKPANSCCKVCPPTTSHPLIPATVQGDYSQPKTTQDILNEGGCIYITKIPYMNGEEWHPRIASHGVEKCITCRCKNGQVNCTRKDCSACRRKNSKEDECCRQCFHHRKRMSGVNTRKHR
ncbi:dorsal-ventral patterning protein Sog isoform X2 [Neocloeon triangulifer]|uniref:dorsal-ventral patterning protein Sog isoform X2 n=1 Tax=Neocloeon triangulifer TaxID=2078957 RepID=UPI00286F85EE|nr:dorsal-ventral patterning protein Sog isoform X2 [Neocloeon triangulifer]